MLVRRTNKGGHTSGTASAENSRTVAHVLMVPIVVRRWPGPVIIAFWHHMQWQCLKCWNATVESSSC